ncbi:MAG: ABC transporter substrate-binding protein [Flavobacteriales bacterium]|nr:MAG: ABC transporter substrate-binding protein [Flavobacteriales bacterium]
MKIKIFLLLVLLSWVSCKKNIEKQDFKQEIKISKNLSYTKENKKLYLQSSQFTYQILEKKLPYKKVVLLNASLIGYFSALNMEKTIVGVSSPQYIYSPKIHQLIDDGQIQKVGNDQKYDVEKILSLQPDAIFTNYIPNFQNTYDVLTKSGIELIFLNEYLEQKPLEKAKYIKVFGELLGQQKKADSLYKVIENHYNAYRQKAASIEKKPLVLTNEMYGNQWYMAGGKTQLANFLKDANADYILKTNTAERSVPMSFEEVFVQSQNAEYWVNAGNHQTKKDLLMLNPNYQQLNVFKNGKIFGMNKRNNGKANDYFESGAVRVDWVLKDYIQVFHPEVFPKDSLMYLNRLQ